MNGLLRLLFGPSIRIAALAIARPLQLVEEALYDFPEDDDLDVPIGYVPVDDFTDADTLWLYEFGVQV